MKRFVSVVFISSFMAVMAVAQSAPTPQAAGTAEPSSAGKTLAEFMTPIKYDGVTLNFVVINPTTADLLFQAPMKYAMRARAAQSTILYIQGKPDKDIDFSTTFTFTQDGKAVTATPTNIKNFTTGKVAKGDRIDGYLTLSEKIDLTKPVTMKYENGAAHDVTFMKQ